jgi:hypothetical protein
MPAQNLFQSYLQPVKSVAEYTADYDAQDMRRAQMENAQRMNALAALQFGAQQDEIAQKRKMQNALQAVYADPANSNPQALESALLRNPYTAERGMTLQKERLANAKTEQDTRESAARTSKDEIANKKAQLDTSLRGIAMFNSPQEAAASIQSEVQQGHIAPEFGQSMLSSIPRDPAQFGTWQLGLMRKLLSAKEQFDVDAEQSRQKETERNNRAQVQKDIDNNIRTNQTSRANNRDTIAGENYRAGVTDKRERELQGAKVVYQDVNGTLTALPSQLPAGATPVARTAVDASGKPVPSKEEGKRTASAKNVLGLLDEADKLIDTSTGSYIGTGADMAAQAFGATTEGAKSSAKLKVLQASLMMNQPRMEGPQSDKDVQLYREAAGQIGDPTVPRDIKKAALATIRQINERYAGMQPGASKADSLQGMGGKPKVVDFGSLK